MNSATEVFRTALQHQAIMIEEHIVEMRSKEIPDLDAIKAYQENLDAIRKQLKKLDEESDEFPCAPA